MTSFLAGLSRRESKEQTQLFRLNNESETDKNRLEIMVYKKM